MAVYEVSTNLSSSLFPFATELWGRSIMFAQYDENYNRTIFSTVDPGFEKQLPQVMYMHNVMPAVEGYQAIGYDTLTGPGPTPGPTGYDRVFQIQTANENKFLFCPAGGKNFIYSGKTSSWHSVSPFADGTVASNVLVTTAFVQGQTYIYYAFYGCFYYDDVGDTLVPVTLSGLNPAIVMGILAANGYMLAFSDQTIAWSSLLDPTDFNPSLVTGAGGGNVNDAKGAVVVAYQISGGFIIYCQDNAVGATYSGNASFPFVFVEVAGSGGIASERDVTWKTNSGTHYIFGNYGVQEITKTAAKGAYPEASDFLAEKLFEDFDEGTLALSSEYLSTQLYSEAVLIENRFLVLSYGKVLGFYTHALVYDMTLKRWGKVKIDHSCCFEWNSPNPYGGVTYGDLASTTYAALSSTTYGDFRDSVAPIARAKKTMAFLQVDGTIKLANFDLSEDVADGVFIMGKFQFQRRRLIQHQYGYVDTVNAGSNFNYYIAPSRDGRTLQPFEACLLGEQSPKTRKYLRRVTGLSIAVLFTGKFSMKSFVIGFTVLGSR